MFNTQIILQLVKYFDYIVRKTEWFANVVIFIFKFNISDPFN